MNSGAWWPKVQLHGGWLDAHAPNAVRWHAGCNDAGAGSSGVMGGPAHTCVVHPLV